MIKFESYKYNDEIRSIEPASKFFTNWPSVYFIHDTEKLYIGETTNFSRRMIQHLDNNDVSVQNGNIDQLCIDTMNKSSILDYEQTFIKLFNSDGKFRLLNISNGQSNDHNYYCRDSYQKEIPNIWNELRIQKLVNKNYEDVVNSDLYRYSPYTSLNTEQMEVKNKILDELSVCLDSDTFHTFVINGAPGTGKTILGVYLIYILNALKFANIDLTTNPELDEDISEEDLVNRKLRRFFQKNKDFKIGFVIPISSLRKTLKSVFRKSKTCLKSSMIIEPIDVIKNKYDLLIVDEAHRLGRYKNQSNYNQYKVAASSLGLDYKTATMLDWILFRSKYQIIFYDGTQSVSGGDLLEEQFINSLKNHNISKYCLTEQMRVVGGHEFLDYIDNILHNKNPKKVYFNKDVYDVRYFDNFEEMFNEIKSKNTENKPSRVLAGYSWKWRTKKLDVEIEGKKYMWNIKGRPYISRPNSIDEIGCIHTVQGYDLNYCAVLFGREIDYDLENNKFIFHKNLFFDKYAKDNCTEEESFKYLINAYRVLLTRGVSGLYIYAYNEGMKVFLKKFFID